MERGLSLVLKHPRALMGKLGEIEGTVVDRLYRNDFKSAKGATAFWERHCKGVALPGSNMGDSHSKDKPSKNHRKGICNDGVWQVVKPDKDSTPTEDRTPPQWPQPAGIFSKDKFSPLKFLKTLRELYGMVWIDEEDGRRFLHLHCLQDASVL
ncbi:hypothetical protein BC826DRAFT_966964 [Russula brevipes]|nr:hypothetical protein BC826DRAFT_966964 [Russula brevipes]